MRFCIGLILLLLTQAGGLTRATANSFEISQIPMTITIVRGGSDKCEPNCPLWIAAEGKITPKTPALLRNALKSLGDRKLPILLDSRGGDLGAAIEMGMMIRDASLTVAVASTGYVNCDPLTLYCYKGKAPQGLYKGFAVYSGFCTSTCILVLAGGKQRLARSAMAITSEHPSTFSKKKSPEQIQEDIQVLLARTIGNFVPLDLMNRATPGAP